MTVTPVNGGASAPQTIYLRQFRIENFDRTESTAP